MDGHRTVFNQNHKFHKPNQEQSKKNALASFRGKPIQKNSIYEKSRQAKVSQVRVRNLSKSSKDCNDLHDDNIDLLDCLEENQSDDSDYQFSMQIMEKNVKQESRRSREDSKIQYLSFFDWMIQISALLKLKKQTVYRAIVMFKKFMFIEQKLPTPQVSINNANLYGLASLLISNKLDNLDGNFLPKIVDLPQSQIKNHLEKQSILECQLYIMKILKFDINDNIKIIQTMIAIINTWNSIIKNTPLSAYTFSPYDRIVSAIQKKEKSKGQYQDNGAELLEIFTYLMDFIMTRKLVQIRVKDMENLDQPIFYKKIIINVLYHLIYFLVNKSNRERAMAESKVFKSVFNLLVFKTKLLKSDHAVLYRKSHLLNKELRNLFSSRSSPKPSQIHKVATHNNTVKRQHCTCNLASLSNKFLDTQQLYKKQQEYQHLIVYQPQAQEKEEREYETDLLIKQPKKKQIVAIAPIIEDCRLPSGYCKICLKDQKLLSGIINSQFYVPVYFNCEQ